MAKQTVEEYINEDADIFSLDNVTYYYVFIDHDNGDEEICLAKYNTVSCQLKWMNYKEDYDLRNRPAEFVKRNRYTYDGGFPSYVDVLIYDVPEEEVA